MFWCRLVSSFVAFSFFFVHSPVWNVDLSERSFCSRAALNEYLLKEFIFHSAGRFPLTKAFSEQTSK